MTDEPFEIGESPGTDLGRAKHRVAASTVTLVASNTAVAALGAYLLHVLTHHLGSTTYGVYVSVIAFITATLLFADLGINTFSGREIARNRDDAPQILGNNLGLRLAMSAAMIPTVVGLGFVFPHSEAARFEGIAIVAFTIPCEAIRSICLSYYVATIQNYKSALVAFISQVVNVAGAVLAIHLGYGVIGCFVAYDISMIATAASAYLLVRRNVSFKLHFRPGTWLGVIRESFGVGAIQIVDILYLKMNVLMLTAMTSYHTVGQFGVSTAIVTYLLAVPNAFMLSMLPVVIRAKDDELTALINRTVTYMAIVGVLAVAGTVCLAHDVISVLAGSSYQESVPILQILSISVLFTCITVVFTYSSFARDRHRLLLFISTSGLVLNVVLNLILIPVLGARGAALSTIIVELAILVGTFSMFRHRVGNHFTDWFRLSRVLLVGGATYLLSRVALDAMKLSDVEGMLVGLVMVPSVLGVLLLAGRCVPGNPTPRSLARGLRNTVATRITT